MLLHLLYFYSDSSAYCVISKVLLIKLHLPQSILLCEFYILSLAALLYQTLNEIIV